MTRTQKMTSTCACGGVELQASGKPIVTSMCYCDDCRKGADRIEALPNAGAVREPDGGTAYILYRKDRIACTKGIDRLKRFKLTARSATNRVVATCCNSAMFVDFDRGPHWISAYRARFHGDIPPLEMRICTRHKPDGVELPDDVPNYKGFSASLVGRLVASRVAMMFGR